MKRKSHLSLVLTSTENFVWASMQEIIPAIEEAWRRASGRGHDVRIVDVDKEPIGSYLADALRADHIVITCFTYKLARVGTFLRREAGVGARYVVYLHNQATIACWPLHAYGPGDVLREDDVFVSSARFDARTLKLTYPKGKVVLHPFWLPEAPAGRREATKEAPTFVYSGRISSQKNLHTLLVAFSLFKEEGLRGRLVFFGGEDGLGSPNMGFKDVGYKAKLEALARELGLSEDVEFAGHLTRDELHQRLEKPHVLVSPSLHSDENFGMSVLRSLCLGNPVVITKWGGHADFKAEFVSQVTEVKVLSSSKGPWVEPVEFARAMAKAGAKLSKPSRRRVPSKYRVTAMAANIRRLVSKPLAKVNPPLLRSKFAVEIERNRDDMKIFSSYADPKCHKLFASYGMTTAKRRKSRKGLTLLPWIHVEGKKVEVRDPHRGSWSLSWNERTGMIQLASFGWAILGEF